MYLFSPVGNVESSVGSRVAINKFNYCFLCVAAFVYCFSLFLHPPPFRVLVVACLVVMPMSAGAVVSNVESSRVLQTVSCSVWSTRLTHLLPSLTSSTHHMPSTTIQGKWITLYLIPPSAIYGQIAL